MSELSLRVMTFVAFVVLLPAAVEIVMYAVFARWRCGAAAQRGASRQRPREERSLQPASEPSQSAVQRILKRRRHHRDQRGRHGQEARPARVPHRLFDR